jgi:hypothetical protein
MKIYKVWFFLLVTGVVPVSAYEKKCYMRPQYGCRGEIQCLTSKYFVCKSYKPVHHVIESLDGRRVCHIRLDKKDEARAEKFLTECLKKFGPDAKIADEGIERMLKQKGSGYKAVGLILHDYRFNYKGITVQQVWDALHKKNEAASQEPCAQCE